MHQREAELSKYDVPPRLYVDEAERRVRDDPDNIFSPRMHRFVFELLSNELDLLLLTLRALHMTSS